MGVTALLAASALAAGAQASNLLTNGDFETGDLSSWTVTDQAGGSGSWYLTANGAGSPLNGFPSPTLGAGGSYNAQTDQGGPGSHSLSQSFNAVAGGSFVLDFAAYANDQGGGPLGTGLDFSGDPNQHVEVLLNGNLLYTGIFSADWASYTFDITSYVVTGSNTLTFGEVDNQLFLNVGVDNVSVTDGGVPEPATWAMMIAGFGLAGATLRRRTVTA